MNTPERYSELYDDLIANGYPDDDAERIATSRLCDEIAEKINQYRKLMRDRQRIK